MSEKQIKKKENFKLIVRFKSDCFLCEKIAVDRN